MGSTKATDVRNGEDYNQCGLVAEVFSLSDWANMMLVTKAGTEEVCGGRKWFHFGMSMTCLWGEFQAGNIILNLSFNKH